MSPTMTEGGIAGWKLKEGDGFVTGDVLLEIVRFELHTPFFALLQDPWGLKRSRG